jgi:5'-nucleotidase
MMNLYLDLDGVMSDFDGQFLSVFGVSHKGMNDDVMWNHINSNPTFFLDMPMCEGAAEFFRDITFLNPTILTACPSSDYRSVALQKREWVRKNLSKEINILPVIGGKNKCLFMQNPGDILIDDFEKNCIPWDELGGISITHKNFEDTRKILSALVGKRI